MHVAALVSCLYEATRMRRWCGERERECEDWKEREESGDSTQHGVAAAHTVCECSAVHRP